MQNQPQTSVQCSNCGQPFNMPVFSIIDVTQTPQAKTLLLTGRLNHAQCPNCGAQNSVAAPILYHDPTKELLIAFVPMELNLPKDEQEKIVGNLMNQLPKESFKSYMFNPKRALTMQGLVDQILEADGVTPEMMEAQRERVRFVQQFIEAPEDQIENLVREHDDIIDMEFFQTLSVIGQRMIEDGRHNVAQVILHRQNQIAELSSYGQDILRQQEEQDQIIEEVAERVHQLGDSAERGDFLDLAFEFMDDDLRLQALTSMVRPVFDYEFFQLLTVEIGKAPSAERENLNILRQKLLDMTSAIDQQAQAALQNVAAFLQTAVNHPNPEELLRENAHMLDNTFMAVLSQNIQHAEQQANVQASTRLKELYDLSVQILQENMQPELRFINQLLTLETDAEATSLLQEQGSEYGDVLLDVIEAVEQVLASQDNPQMTNRLQTIKSEAQQILSR